MIGATLGFYFGRKTFAAVMAIFVIAFAIVLLFDFLDMVRANVDRPAFTWFTAFLASFCRVPAFSEQVLPFATLFGMMTALLGLSRKLELVVARASGISAWQFLFPAIVVAVGIGLFSALVYNPVAAALKEKSEDFAFQLSGDQPRAVEGAREIWLRQSSEEGEAIIHALRSSERGLHLAGVTIQAFDDRGLFNRRIEAATADHRGDHWDLTKVRILRPGAAPEVAETGRIGTRLKREQVGESLAEPDTVSFWALPSFIAAARNAGLPAFQFELQYQLLLSRPLLLVAMVLIAATVSLRVFRFGNIGRMIIGGVGAGFVLYVAGEVARGLGGAGVVPPILAAWSPAVIASSIGFTILLHQEDG